MKKLLITGLIGAIAMIGASISGPATAASPIAPVTRIAGPA